MTKRTLKIKYPEFPTTGNFPLIYDERGFFSPSVLQDSWIQSNLSFNEKPFIFRGMHYQEGSYAQKKIVQVITGRIVDFVIDIRRDSESFGEVNSWTLEAGNMIEVPRGYAHGFLTLQENTLIQYFVDNVYSPHHEGSIAWNTVDGVFDEIIEHVQKPSNVIISAKDAKAETWDDFAERMLQF
jgi:dTDP-4-dehydrorhamnose 3,5-epimerase